MKTLLVTLLSISLTLRQAATPVTVTFSCETCTGKGKLMINGNGYSKTQEFTVKKGEKPAFPLELSLEPGEYKLTYWQNKVLQIQSSFTVKEGEATTVKVK